MSQSRHSQSRRHFLATGVAVTTAVPFIGFASSAGAAEMPRLEESDPTAQALGYVHDASTVPAETRKGEGNVCANCRLYLGGDAEWGGCSLFPGKAVAAQGWCKGWVAQG